MSKALSTPSTRALVYALRRALRLGHDTPATRRARGPSLPWRAPTLTAAMAIFHAQGVIPRGRTTWVRRWCPALLAGQAPATAPPPLRVRRAAYLVAQYSAEISRRGGEVSIQGQDRAYPLTLADEAGGLYLLRAEGWRHYSRAFGARPASLAYLCGRDDNGRWAVRVPATCRRVADAQPRIEPAAVQQARDWGRTVLRQGDVYAVETLPGHDGRGVRDLPPNHRWDPVSRHLQHLDPQAPHATLHIPFPCRFVTQQVLRMGRLSPGSARSAYGD